MPDNYRGFRVEGLLGVTVAVPWRNATTLITTNFRGHTDIALVSNDGFLSYAEAVAIKETAVKLLMKAAAVPEVVEARMAANY
jgi:hypothetical protein